MPSLHFLDPHYMPPCTPAIPAYSSFPNVQLSVFKKPSLAFPGVARWMPLLMDASVYPHAVCPPCSILLYPIPAWLTLISPHDSGYHSSTKILTAILVPQSELTDSSLCSYSIKSISLHSKYNTESLFLKICLIPLICKSSEDKS